jgi:hypothetical protein
VTEEWTHDPDAATAQNDADAIEDAWEVFATDEETVVSRAAFEGGYRLALRHVRDKLGELSIDAQAEAERTPNDFLRGYAMGASISAGDAGTPAEFWASPQRQERVAARAAELDREDADETKGATR